MARTRSSKGTTASADEKTVASKSSFSTYTLSASSDNPPKLFVLPKTTTPSARIITLQNPRSSKPTRYLVCPEAGFFEFTNISPPKSAPRSWLIQPSPPPQPPKENQIPTQTIQSPTLHLATPFDPLFLLLPALFPSQSSSSSSSASSDKTKRLFLAPEDHLDATPDPARHLSELLSSSESEAPCRKLLESRLAAVCDTVDAGGETMYRVSEGKVVREVWGKARRMVGEDTDGQREGKLPGSMEERFVRKVLEAPVVGVKVAGGGCVARQGSGSGSPVDGEGGDGSPVEEAGESQSSVGSAASVVTSASEASAASTAATSVAEGEGETDAVVSAMTASEEVVRLQRLRVAFDFICSRYIAPPIAETLKAGLAKETALVDFKPLDEYLTKLAKLRQEAVAARSTDYSRKRGNDEEEDERAEKRRKKEAEEKAKKANQSRGVKELMKVNTSGMKKLSEFFKKKA